MGAPRSQLAKSRPPAFATTLNARVLRHDPDLGLSTLFFGDGELRVPLVDAPADFGVKVTIFARDVSIACRAQWTCRSPTACLERFWQWSRRHFLTCG